MNREKFRYHYLMSIGLTILATVIIFAAIIFLLFSAGSTIGQEILNPNSNPDTVIQSMSSVIWDILFKSVYCLIGFGLYIIGTIWNIIISYMRSVTQKNHTLTIAVVIGWTAFFIFPVIGFLISMVLQVWAWFLGSKISVNDKPIQ